MRQGGSTWRGGFRHGPLTVGPLGGRSPRIFGWRRRTEVNKLTRVARGGDFTWSGRITDICAALS